jgi:hypothetical protein
MNRIITANYIENISGLISNYKKTTSLNSLVDFFIEEVKKDQNRKVNKNQKVFSGKDLEKLNEIKNSDELKRIFVYINIIINAFTGQYLQIHINEDLSESYIDNLITLFAWEAIIGSSFCEDHLDSEINSLKLQTNRDIIVPSDNKKHATNQIFRKINGLRHRLIFFEKIKCLHKNTGNNGLLLNLNKSTDGCVNLSDFSMFPKTLNTHVNFGNSLQAIYESNNSILQNISTIISLFPAERGRNIWYNDFTAYNINAWNQLPAFNFKKVVTITTEKKTPNELLEMQKQKKFQSEEIYTIFSFEL